MKIIHTADLHLNSKLNTHFSREVSLSRNQEITDTFLRLVMYAVKNHVEIILIAGDMFDENKANEENISLIKDAILENPEITFCYLRGNHEGNILSDMFHELPSNLYISSSSSLLYSKRNVRIYSMEDDGIPYKSRMNTLNIEDDKVNILMLHGQAMDTERENGRVVPMRVFKNIGLDYIALGHIHQYKKWDIDSRCYAVYSGCLEGRGFDECGDCGFSLIDIDEESNKVTSKFVPFALRRLYCIDIKVTESKNSKEVLYEILCSFEEKGITNDDMVKVTIYKSSADLYEIDSHYIEDELSRRVFFIKVIDETSEKELVSYYENDESLKGEFVRNVLNDTSIDEEDKEVIIQYGIRLLRGEEDI